MRVEKTFAVPALLSKLNRATRHYDVFLESVGTSTRNHAKAQSLNSIDRSIASSPPPRSATQREPLTPCGGRQL